MTALSMYHRLVLNDEVVICTGPNSAWVHRRNRRISKIPIPGNPTQPNAIQFGLVRDTRQSVTQEAVLALRHHLRLDVGVSMDSFPFLP